MKLTTLAIAIVCLTSLKAYAEDPNWNGDPEPEPPVVVEPPVVDYPPGIVLDPPVFMKFDPSDTSEYENYSRIYYAVCTCDEMKVAWGFESLELRTNKARMQCEQRRERIQCPMKWK